MSDEDPPQEEPTDPGVVARGFVSVTGSSAQGDQRITPAQARYLREMAQEQHDREMARVKQTFDLEEVRKDNEKRRRREEVVFYVSVFVVLACLGIGFWLAAQGETESARSLGADVLKIVISAVAGLLVGLASGRRD